MKRRRKRGISLGTIVMLMTTCLVLAGFFLLMPRLAGQTDLRFHAGDVFVVLDRTLGEITSGATQQPTETPTPLAMAIFTPAPTPVPTPAPEYRFTFCASGEISFTGAVQKSVTYDDGYHFEQILEPIKDDLAADLTLVTLNNSTVSTDKLTDYNMPVQMLQGLKQNNIDAVNLGHYNTLNGGLSALSTTRNELVSAGMMPYGAYSLPAERNTPRIYNAGGVSVALISFVADLSNTSKKQTTAEERAFAVPALNLADIETDIAKARSMGAQVIVVTVSWGKSGDTKPSAEQLGLAQSMADLGADIIIGVHPEAVETVQILTANRGDGKYHPVLCAYSLGNLFSADREKRVNLSGLLLHAEVEYDPVSQTVAFDNLHYTPTYCWRGKQDGAYRYKVFASNLDAYPDYVDKDQRSVMNRCLKVITDAMEGSIFDQ